MSTSLAPEASPGLVPTSSPTDWTPPSPDTYSTVSPSPNTYSTVSPSPDTNPTVSPLPPFRWATPSNGLSPGALAGIIGGIVGAIIVAIGVCIFVFRYWRKKRKGAESRLGGLLSQGPKDDDLEASRKETKPVVASPASSITKPQVRHAPDPKAKPAEPTGVPTTLEKLESIKLKSYKYEELAAATDWFSESNHLGEGGYGAVYKGTFPNGEVVAIKKLKGESGEAEILAVSSVRHRYLVKLYGYCVDEANRLIVYEYVPNNSLRSHLHGKGKRPVLSWSNRMRIAIGSAKGLEYLHQGCDRKIIHRDIKADNILLDHNFEPKIADFGLARDCSYSVTHISTDTKGTFGYLAPEYITDRKLTDKSDIFSYGVVLLELITGKKSVLFEDTESYNLAAWMVIQIKKTLESGRYRELVDPELEKEYIDENELGRMLHCAAACIYKPANDRPNMRQIVEALQGNIPLEQIWTISDSQFLYDGAPYLSLLQ